MPGSALELADAVVGLIAGRCLTKRLTRAAGSAGIAGTARAVRPSSTGRPGGLPIPHHGALALTDRRCIAAIVRSAGCCPNKLGGPPTGRGSMVRKSAPSSRSEAFRFHAFEELALLVAQS